MLKNSRYDCNKINISILILLNINKFSRIDLLKLKIFLILKQK